MFDLYWNVFSSAGLVLLLSLCRNAHGWHDFTNTDYHCWPLTASANDPVPYNPCPGVNIRWVKEPPSSVKVGQDFTTVTELILTNKFYEWAVGPDYQFFTSANNSAGITNAVDAQNWCETTTCPLGTSSTAETCCIHHMNVHSCPLSSTLQNNLCGPWISPQGNVYTHSTVLFGHALQGNWTNNIGGLYIEGDTSLIAHFKVASMQIALVKNVEVLPKTVCGDSKCETTEGETCSICPADCGRCPLKAWEIALIVVFAVLILFVLLGVLVYIRYQKRKMLLDESWIYHYEDIAEDKDTRNVYGSVVSMARGFSATTDDLKSIGAGSITFSTAKFQVFIKTGVIDGKRVAIKSIKKHHMSLSTQIREEVRQVRIMDHPNLCKFVGACIKVPNVCILMEYCCKGSLNDVLMNDEVPLSWSFRFSFATDIAKGMHYLHNHKIIHGRLTSNNCVIDDRWACKITDYGLFTLRSCHYESEEDAQADLLRNKVYLPPEANGDLSYARQEGDVYSYSIILVEIVTRNGPYGDEDPSSVSDSWKPPLPNLEKSYESDECPCPTEYCNLISICWNRIPQERPSFDFVKNRLRKINPNKQSPVDLMMTMMEKYSKHLETIVADRTRELVIEKQKTDRLLYSMLPQAVADKLRVGNPVEAENFEICTIYFSDIVGFTTICSQSTALQVVALLNKLYTTFDGIIEKYIVYKVETIGDAYMVVSGVPKPTPTHAKEVADMAIDIIAACKVFKIPHLLDINLKIRVGLHSGPVCAGVVGLKMPRYCLFGDTVNTASRMESNGEAFRIHISNYTYSELIASGGYDFQERGTIPVKGKGEMKTWWLQGKSLTNKTDSDTKCVEEELERLIIADNERNNVKIATPIPNVIDY